MQCYLCHGEMHNIKKDIEANWKGHEVIVRGLSAWVCQQCNEEVYDPADVRLMQGLVRGAIESPDFPEILNVEEAADLLRVSNQTVYNLIKQGRLTAAKIGREWRFSRDAILDMISGPKVAMAARDLDGTGVSSHDQEVIQRHLQEMSRT